MRRQHIVKAERPEREEDMKNLKYIVSVNYEEFIFTDGCAALAYAEVSKKKASKADLRVEIKIETLPDESVFE